jgi:DNA repair exonuclease SbcCD ATPase subunit
MQIPPEPIPLLPLNHNQSRIMNPSIQMADTDQYSHQNPQTNAPAQQMANTDDSNGNLSRRQRNILNERDEDEEQSPDHSRRRTSNGRIGGKRNATHLHGRSVSKDLAAVVRNANNKDDDPHMVMLIDQFAEGNKVKREGLQHKKIHDLRAQINNLKEQINASRNTVNSTTKTILDMLAMMGSNPNPMIQRMLDANNKQIETLNKEIEADERALVEAKARLAALEAQQEEQVPAAIEQRSNVASAQNAVHEAVAEGGEGEAADANTDVPRRAASPGNIPPAPWTASLSRLNTDG